MDPVNAGLAGDAANEFLLNRSGNQGNPQNIKGNVLGGNPFLSLASRAPKVLAEHFAGGVNPDSRVAKVADWANKPLPVFDKTDKTNVATSAVKHAPPPAPIAPPVVTPSPVSSKEPAAVNTQQPAAVPQNTTNPKAPNYVDPETGLRYAAPGVMDNSVQSLPWGTHQWTNSGIPAIQTQINQR